MVGNRWRVGLAALLSIFLVVCLDLLTNSLDTHRFSWDFRYYIGMAQNGLRPPLASPFAYRYVTPGLSYFLTHFLGLGIEPAFRIVAYVGAFWQLLGVFLFTRWITRSTWGAYVALVVTALSIYNVKFLLFDVYRPDHLAYALILLQAYFALRRQFLPLFISTLAASQVREFNIIPLLAYLFAAWRVLRQAPPSLRRNRSFLLEAVVSIVGLAGAVVLPRLLIPVSENFQFADLSQFGLLRIVIAPLVLARDANFLYSLAAYALPVLMLLGFEEFRSTWESVRPTARPFVGAYVGLVVIFSFLGGTDFPRFTSYLFMPLAIFVGTLVQRRRAWQVGVMLLALFIFNRVWLPFPMADVGTYLDFYGGWADRFNGASLMRLVELLSLVVLGVLVRRIRPAPGLQMPRPPA
jgi:hypothetical protein